MNEATKTPRPRKQKRQWTPKAARFAIIAGVLREFSCYATRSEILAALRKTGRNAYDHKVAADLLELVAAGTLDRIGEGHRGSPYHYCLISENIPAPPQVFNPMPPPDPLAGYRARLEGRSPPVRRPREPKVTDQQIADALQQCDGNGTAAARMLGVSKQLISQRRRRATQQPTAPAAPRQQNSRLISPPPLPCAEKPPHEPPRPAPSRPRPEYTPPPASPEELAALWKLHKSDPTESRRNALAEFYLPLVKYHAERMAKKLPDTVEVGDLISAGYAGLFGAIGTFDPDRGIRFETYAPMRIRGEMLDYLREMDWAPRLIRAKASRIARAKEKLSRELGRDPESAELARHLGLSLAELEEDIAECRSIHVTSLDKKFYETDSFKDVREVDGLRDARAPAPHAHLHDLDQLRKMTRGLNKHERLIIIGYYYLGETMRECGEQIGLSMTRVSQMHSSIIERMRRQMAA